MNYYHQKQESLINFDKQGPMLKTLQAFFPLRIVKGIFFIYFWLFQFLKKVHKVVIMQQKSDTRLVCIFDLAKAAVLASKTR